MQVHLLVCRNYQKKKVWNSRQFPIGLGIPSVSKCCSARCKWPELNEWLRFGKLNEKPITLLTDENYAQWDLISGWMVWRLTIQRAQQLRSSGVNEWRPLSFSIITRQEMWLLSLSRFTSIARWLAVRRIPDWWFPCLGHIGKRQRWCDARCTKGYLDNLAGQKYFETFSILNV